MICDSSEQRLGQRANNIGKWAFVIKGGQGLYKAVERRSKQAGRCLVSYTEDDLRELKLKRWRQNCTIKKNGHLSYRS
jgi:hypothetical protein